jgi:hypothetical protein
MKVYRIYTEMTNRKAIEGMVAESFEGFTTFRARGYWAGERENSLVIEIATYDEAKVYDLARIIGQANHQEAVMVTVSEATGMLVIPDGANVEMN